jgi:hypothetical protein
VARVSRGSRPGDLERFTVLTNVLQISGLLAGDVKESRNKNPCGAQKLRRA